VTLRTDDGDDKGKDNPSAMNYANWLQRVGAYLIDSVPNIVLGIIGNATGKLPIILLVNIVSLAWWVYNRGYLAGTTGQSWGKKLLNLKLIGEATGQPLGFGMALVRDICHLVDAIICYIGFLFPLWDAKRQTLADKIIKTVVVNV
jgi:uncharacterized RDD family membrane protein YckC